MAIRRKALGFLGAECNHCHGASTFMAMATGLGTPTFDENQDDWDIYLTQLEAFFEADDINKENKERALLISTLSTNMVSVLGAHCTFTLKKIS
ncbi:hypothetical protein MTO96_042906 [Rhipicephalus appendiculatus]